MQISKINDVFSIGPQITPEDVPALKASGYNTIMCNRPDGETFGQPPADAIKAAAERLGMKFAYVPMSHRGYDMQTVNEFRKALNEAEKPIFAYCRTGNRCNILWNAAHS